MAPQKYSIKLSSQWNFRRKMLMQEEDADVACFFNHLLDK